MSGPRGSTLPVKKIKLALLRNFRVAPLKTVCYDLAQGMWKGNTWEDQYGTFNHPWQDSYVLRYRPNTVFDQQIS
jgi:hypothetical protein